MDITIAYRLVGTGWAECLISDEKTSCEVTASYLSDALRTLVLAATALASGFSRLSFRFDEEPGEHRWVISSPRMNEIELQILAFDQLWGNRPDIEGRSLFRTRCLPETFAKAVAVAARTVLEEHRESGYLERWSEHPFPTIQLEELERLLREQSRDP
jgi:hypothetical protein